MDPQSESVKGSHAPPTHVKRNPNVLFSSPSCAPPERDPSPVSFCEPCWPRTDHTMRELPGGRRTPESPPRARDLRATPLQCANPRRTVDPGRRPAGPPAVLKAACRDPAVRCAGCPARPRPPSGTRQPGGPSQPSPCGAPARAPRPDVFRPRPPRCRAQFRLRPGPPLPEFPAPDAPVARLPVPSLPTLAVGMRQDPRHPRDRAPHVGLRAARGSGARSACLRRGPPGCPPPGTATPPRPAAARPPEAPASGLPSRLPAPPPPR